MRGMIKNCIWDQHLEAFSKPSQTSKMEFFVKIAAGILWEGISLDNQE